jgi:hypothetical protein
MTPSQYVVMLVMIYDKSDKLKRIVDKLDTTKELLKRLKEEYKDSKDQETVDIQ